MKKLFNKKGFTLMEMMIVIAIIVILVAISIPTFSGSLEKANKATDEANLRAAKAAYLTQSMLESTDGDAILTTKSYYYDFKQGKLVACDSEDAAKTAAEASKSTGSCSNHTGDYIKVDHANKKVVWTGSGNLESCE